MAENSNIEWCDHTFNPWIGCTKVGPGCDHCYAERRMDARLHVVQWGAGKQRKRTSAANWREPVRWNAQAEDFAKTYGRRQRVFCASLADVFDNSVEPQWRADLFALIAATPNLDWLLLTKRIGNVAGMLGDYQTVPLLPNIWLGATVVNQEEADRDIPKLLRVPAAVRFLSIEPMLGPIDLGVPLNVSQYEDGSVWSPRNLKSHDTGVHWVICGGESGPSARPMSPDWARALRDQCAAAGVPFLFKQWGEWAPNWFNDNDGKKIADSEWMDRMGKKSAGRALDGAILDGYPTTASRQPTMPAVR